MLFLLLLHSFILTTVAEFSVSFNHQTGCKSLEVENQAFELVRDDIMYLQFNINSVITPKLRNGYLREEDNEGETCLTSIELKLNQTIENFRKNILDLQYSKEMLDIYLYNPEVLSRRSVGGVAVAISILDLIATGATYFYTDYRIRALKTRFGEMNELLTEMNDEKLVFSKNQEYLFKEGKIMGLHRDLITDHINQLAQMHSCEVLYLNFEMELFKLQVTLDKIVQALLTGRLTTDIISLDALTELTFKPYFYNSIYNFSPTHLYSLSKLSLHSLSGTKLTFMLSFPFVSRNQNFKRINILETSQKLLINRHDFSNHVHFLLPYNVSLNNFSISQIRSGENCFYSGDLLICEPNSILPAHSSHCIKSLILNEKTENCFGNGIQTDLSFSYGTNGVLIDTKKGGRLLDISTRRVIKSFVGHRCIYVKKKRNVAFVVEGNKKELFPDTVAFNSRALVKSNALIFRSKRIKNITLPTLHNPFSFKNVTFLKKSGSVLDILKEPLVATCLIIFVIGAMTFCIICYLCVSRCCKQSDSNVNLNFRGGIDAGALNR